MTRSSRTVLSLAVVALVAALPRAQVSPAVVVQQAAPPRPAPPRAIAPAFAKTDGTLFDNVVGILQERYFDGRFRADRIPRLAARYRGKASEARTLREQRQVVHELLSEIPASHLGLISATTHEALVADLMGRPYPTFGFQLIGAAGGYFAAMILEGGPAERAGLLTGDRIARIDGIAADQSPRLDWRSDDAYIKDDRDPPVHYVLAERGHEVALDVERRPGEYTTVRIRAEDYSAFDAARASARVLTHEGRRFGYIHFWYVHLTGVPQLLEEKIDGDFRACDGLIVDLRGRGGSFVEIAKIVEVLRAYRALESRGDSRASARSASPGRAVVALVDRQSRSGKDILAYELKQSGIARLVGEPSAGAVIPATFADVGHQTLLMFPSRTLGRYTDLLEFKPVQPDVPVERAGPFAAGADPILRAGLEEASRRVRRPLPDDARPASGEPDYLSGVK